MNTSSSRAASASAPGRPASGSGVVLALDLGGSLIRAAAVDLAGDVSHRTEVATPVASGPDAIVDACVDRLALVRSDLERDPGEARPVLAVGVSAPGPIDPYRGVAVDPPNLGPAFVDIQLAERIAAALQLTAFVDRDTQVAALAEGRHGAARGCTDFIYVTVSTGIGGAVISDGRVLRGPDGGAGELGHLLIDRTGPLCGCGARGHLEAIASGVAITRAARVVIERGDSPALADAARAVGPGFGAKEVVAVAHAGDPAAAAIVADAIDAFAAACVALVDIFNPTLIVVGGGLARGLGTSLLEPARQAVAELAFRMSARRVRLVPSELGDDVGLVGAALLVAERLRIPLPGDA